MTDMQSRILNTLEAYLITNKDVLPEEKIKDLEEQIVIVKEYKRKDRMSLFFEVGLKR